MVESLDFNVEYIHVYVALMSVLYQIGDLKRFKTFI
jgi:hypothetical protein